MSAWAVLYFEWPLFAVLMSRTEVKSDFLVQQPHTGSVTKIEADSSFDLLHISFNLSTCVSEHGIKKMEITFIYTVLTDCRSHSHCSIQPSTTQTEWDWAFSPLIFTTNWWRDVVSVMWRRYIRGRVQCCLMICLLFTWGVYDLCSFHCINVTWICKVSQRQCWAAAHSLDDTQSSQYRPSLPLDTCWVTDESNRTYHKQLFFLFLLHLQQTDSSEGMLLTYMGLRKTPGTCMYKTFSGMRLNRIAAETYYKFKDPLQTYILYRKILLWIIFCVWYGFSAQKTFNYKMSPTSLKSPFNMCTGRFHITLLSVAYWTMIDFQSSCVF